MIDPTTGNDIEAQNLAKAIRQRESGGNFNAVGDAGTSHGGYQFQKNTWKQYAKEVLGDENAEMTPQNQNAVAYGKIKKWKDGGKSAAEIAAMWNAGENIGDRWMTNKGKTTINGKVLTYDTPQYVKDVTDLYQQFKSQTPQQTTQTQPQIEKKFADKTRTEIFNEDINKRGEQLSRGVESLIGGEAKTGQSRISGLIQTVGAGAGALGDVTSAALRLIPGVKQLEGAIGTGIENLAQTEAGKSILKSMKEFADEHPELAKDIGAGFDIATAIPILKGLSVVKNLAYDGASMALKNQAEKTFNSEIGRIVGSTQKGTNLLRRNPEVASSLIKEGIIPDIKDGKFNVAKVYNDNVAKLNQLSQKVKSTLKNDVETRVANENVEILDKVIKGYVDRNGKTIPGFPNSKLTPNQILGIAEDFTPKNAKLWDKFKVGAASIEEIDTLRSELDRAVRTVYTSMNKAPFDKEVGAALAGSMRDFIQTFKPETQDLFKQMESIYNAQEVLKLINGKTLRPSSIFGTVENITKDVPVASYIGKKIGSKGPETTIGILKRTGKNTTTRTSKKQLKKLPGLFTGMINQ